MIIDRDLAVILVLLFNSGLELLLVFSFLFLLGRMGRIRLQGLGVVILIVFLSLACNSTVVVLDTVPACVCVCVCLCLCYLNCISFCAHQSQLRPRRPVLNYKRIRLIHALVPCWNNIFYHTA